MRLALCSLIMLLALPASAEPVNGWLTGEEDDFLQFICKPLSEGRKECTFTQVTTRLKQDPEEIDALIRKRLPEALSEIANARTNGELADMCGYTRPLNNIVEGLLKDDRETVRKTISELPEQFQEEFNLDEAVEKMAQSDAREMNDILSQMSVVTRLCEKYLDASDVEELIRWELEKNARTCKLHLNSWTDIFMKVSNEVWTLEGSSAKGICAVSPLDRFECEGAYNCSYTAEKRVFNKEGERIIPCGDLEEDAFRYEHGKDIYLDCSVMSRF